MPTELNNTTTVPEVSVEPKVRKPRVPKEPKIDAPSEDNSKSKARKPRAPKEPKADASAEAKGKSKKPKADAPTDDKAEDKPKTRAPKEPKADAPVDGDAPAEDKPKPKTRKPRVPKEPKADAPVDGDAPAEATDKPKTRKPRAPKEPKADAPAKKSKSNTSVKDAMEPIAVSPSTEFEMTQVEGAFYMIHKVSLKAYRANLDKEDDERALLDEQVGVFDKESGAILPIFDDE